MTWPQKYVLVTLRNCLLIVFNVLLFLVLICLIRRKGTLPFPCRISNQQSAK